MLPPHDTWTLDTRRLGRRVLVFEQLESSNTLALQLAGLPDTEGLALLADEQLAGRGQHGRRWLAPPRSSVLLSLLLYPPPALDRPVLLTAWAAVCVCEVAGRLTGTRAAIKWPNDVQLAGRKVCGILIEQTRQGDLPATVVGIGLNVTQSEGDLTNAGLIAATSLSARGASALDTHAVARLLLATLDEEYDRLHRGEVARLEAAWGESLGLLGQEVVVEGPDRDFVGRLVGCGFDGLVLNQSGQGNRVIPPEGIRHLRRC